MTSEKSNGNETWRTMDVTAVDMTDAVLFDLSPDTTYRVVVQSRSCCGTSSASHEAQFSDPKTARTPGKSSRVESKSALRGASHS